MFPDARRASGHHRAAAVEAPKLVDESHALPKPGGLSASLALFLLLGTLSRLDPAFVDLGHGLGDLAGGELTATARRQATKRVVLVELRRGRFRSPRLDLFDHRGKSHGLVRNRLFVALDE